jgi:uncharacterized protein (UPF0276 family)
MSEHQWPIADLGHGIGLRREHFTHLLENGPAGIDWFEVISENYFEPGGRPWAVLDRVRRDVPVVVHGVSMAIGNVAPVPLSYLESLKKLIARVEPAMVSDHLCWGGFGGHYAHDLLPLPYTEEALDKVVSQVARVQEILGRRIMLENASSYVAYRASTMTEWDFLAAVAQRADCGILLDVNNIYVSARNHGFSADDYLNGIPIGRVGQFHVAGHTDKGSYILDSHIGPVPDPVWALYQKAVQRFGRVPTLVEWDENIPPYFEVVA